MMTGEEGGRFFRQAWIDGVNQYYPGTPKAGYIAPWEEISIWEQEAVTEIYAQLQALIRAGKGDERGYHLSREQGGRVVRLGWIAQVYKHIPQPKPAYVCPWEEMSDWEQQTDCDIFQAIEEVNA